MKKSFSADKAFESMARGPARRMLKRGPLVLLFALLAVSLALSSALAAEVNTVANPGTTTIDVFDYWVYNNQGESVVTIVGNGNSVNTGINQNHTFKFAMDGNQIATEIGQWNAWTGGGGGARQGIVKKKLDENGYPVLDVSNQSSLGYLFDNTQFNDGNNRPAKRTYAGADYLFTVDADGYYYFDSDKHNATLNTANGEFTVEEYPAGKKGFFPVSTGPGTDPDDRWFFGVHMQTDFSVPEKGQVLNQNGELRDMTYEFSGDDDVWVFIDGVLVGDVGGIHDAQDLSINFATGAVKVNNHANTNDHVYTTTIKQAFIDAGVANQYVWRGDTFADGTYHTLDFFYIERGAGVSNMKIKFNLVATYDFTAHKVLYRSNTSQPALTENQFYYKLTGYDLEQEDGETLPAPMPGKKPDRDVYWEPDYGGNPRTLITGNSMNGDIDFGNVNMQSIIIEKYTNRSAMSSRSLFRLPTAILL